jgi:hypothetical protein
MLLTWHHEADSFVNPAAAKLEEIRHPIEIVIFSLHQPIIRDWLGWKIVIKSFVDEVLPAKRPATFVVLVGGLGVSIARCKALRTSIARWTTCASLCSTPHASEGVCYRLDKSRGKSVAGSKAGQTEEPGDSTGQ